MDPNWKAAVEEEFISLEENDVWLWIKPQPGQGIISKKWHFGHKPDDGAKNVVIYKARIVALGLLRIRALIFTTPTPLQRNCLYSELSGHVG